MPALFLPWLCCSDGCTDWSVFCLWENNHSFIWVSAILLKSEEWGFCLWLPWLLTFNLCLKPVSESPQWQQLKPWIWLNLSAKLALLVIQPAQLMWWERWTCLLVSNGSHIHMCPMRDCPWIDYNGRQYSYSKQFINFLFRFFLVLFSSQNLGIKKHLKVLHLSPFWYFIIMKTCVFLNINVWFSLASQMNIKCLFNVCQVNADIKLLLDLHTFLSSQH